MNKRLLLISANTCQAPYPIHPLGLSYLKAHLGQVAPEWQVQLYDMNFGSIEDLQSVLQANSFQYVGLSMRNIDDNNLFSSNFFVEGYRSIAQCIRANSQATFLVGGAGFSIYPDILLEELHADYGVKGEGEESLAALLQGAPIESIEGLVYRRPDNSIQINPRKNFIHAPALQFDESSIDYYWDRSGMLNIQTKRGCPYRCIYCSYPVIEGRKIRTLDSTIIVETLKELYFNKHINYVFFTDSVFNIHREYNRELCTRIIESGIKISWGAYFAPNNLTKEDLALYKKAGLTHIEFGSESFSNQQLENYRKGFTWDDILEKSHFCDELGIFYAHFMILGGYGETEESLEETFIRSRQLTNTVIFPYIGMRIYPETRLYDIAIQEGKIKSRYDLLHPVYYVADGICVETIEARAKATGAKWVFPDDGNDDLIEKFRARKRRGPLWEYLRY